MEVGMATLRSVVIGFLTLVLGLSSSAFGSERHAVEPAKLAQAVAHRVAQENADRRAVREALANPEVVRLAESLGIDVARLKASVDTMDADALARAASAAAEVNRPLVGGASTITISTTTVIIGLLIIILILVAD
jgi:hypothetical protein